MPRNEVFLHVHVPDARTIRFLYTRLGKRQRRCGAAVSCRYHLIFTFDNAPPPKFIVIPAQDGKSSALLDWIRRTSKTADLTTSICTGAFVLARTGLLSGKSATTHHGEYKKFVMKYPDVHAVRGVRFVEYGDVANAGGLSSGMILRCTSSTATLAEVAQRTAEEPDYKGVGWGDAASCEPASAGKFPVIEEVSSTNRIIST